MTIEEKIDEAIELMKNEKACILKADTCDRNCQKCKLVRKTEDLLSAYDLAIKSLEMQRELEVFSGMDICNWVEDYDYEENNISQYEFETSVNNFLIDKTEKGEMNEN